MIRFLFRSIAVMCLAIAVIFAVVDAARSIGASTLVLTPLTDSWDSALPGTRIALGQWLNDSVHPIAADPVFTTIVTWPTVLIFGGLALLCGLLGRPPRRRPGFGGR